ncbi:uncharacterized protein LOC110754985 [Prunus avium]|uniref:Uncharacterized protein LOC110754985 n=1 Tax=Prunus avium TaxID=42229 RepID=A0A6P5SBL7_PRUAV|nr:uncharacterized protein LOC110754985 [Prunus avium]XP_021811816.1 uncharacterized protein LOC110754985 [Prunus avium]XP_021811817.1 uncharacterized protein LOC110754985 [Prunus avium]
MEKTQKITQYRERLDRTLASPNLTNKEALKLLVKKQLIRSSENEIGGCNENVIEEKTAEVSNLLDMLRSACIVDDKGLTTCETTSHPEWKLKHDNEQFRVMYREGIQGTPFHTLLVEGYVDGSVDDCLCASWEADLYKKWWPQSTIPTFKILSAKCLQKVRIGEQISLVRMKVPWPLSPREAVVHYFMFEYFQEDLIVVLLKSVSDSESIDGVRGLTNEETAGAKDLVRIDVVGGFAIQKVTKERSYFRTIATMDIKMDFVPPSLINFFSRQLIGNGFRLYQKAVSSKLNCDGDYSKALEGPLYTQIREALFPLNEPNRPLEGERLNSDTSNLSEEHLMKNQMSDLKLVDMDQKVENDQPASEAAPDDAQVHPVSKLMSDDALVTGRSTFGEIEEVESKDGWQLENQTSNRVAEKGLVNGKRNVVISSEVEQALGTLEKVIYKVRKNGLNAQIRSSSGFTNEIPRKETDGGNPKALESGVCISGERFVEASKEVIERTLPKSVTNSSGIHNLSYAGSNSLSKEVNQNRIVPTSLEQELSISCDNNQSALRSSKYGTAEVPVLDLDDIMNSTTNHMSSKANGMDESGPNRAKKMRQQRKHRYCCFSMN